MNVLFVAAEAVPFAKTGGLADVVGSLPKALKKLGVEARVVIPKYSSIAPKLRERLTCRKRLIVPVGWRRQYCGVEETEYDGIKFYLLDNEYYFRRPNLYGFYDEAERFAFFCRAVLESIPYLDFAPDILHCHDWHAGMVNVFLRAHYGHIPNYSKIRTVFTIHNLEYQGVFPYSILYDLLGLGDDYFTIDGVEYYGDVSFMKGALNFADLITTVSDTYAREIQTPFFGHGLDGLLRKRSGDLHGVLNGIDYGVYNPATDSHIYVNYTADSARKKKENKMRLQQELELPEREDVPVVGIVSRLANQKGFDLVACILDEILSMDLQLVVLGTGEWKYEALFRDAAYRYPEKVSANILFNDALARKIYAGSDMFLMPSLYEPCGLSQLIALRYGSLPIVRETGGLNDTVKPYNEFGGEGNGFTFTNYNAHDMLHTIRRAVKFYHQPETWVKLVQTAMKADYSWNHSAREYRKLYAQLLA